MWRRRLVAAILFLFSSTRPRTPSSRELVTPPSDHDHSPENEVVEIILKPINAAKYQAIPRIDRDRVFASTSSPHERSDCGSERPKSPGCRSAHPGYSRSINRI